MPIVNFNHYLINPEYDFLMPFLSVDNGDEVVRHFTPANINKEIGVGTWANYSILEIAIYSERLCCVKKLLNAEGIDLNKITKGYSSILEFVLTLYSQKPSSELKQIILEILKKNPSVTHPIISHLARNLPDKALGKLLILMKDFQQTDHKASIASNIATHYSTNIKDLEEAVKWDIISLEHGHKHGHYNLGIQLRRHKQYVDAIESFKTAFSKYPENSTDRNDVIKKLKQLITNEYEFATLQDYFKTIFTAAKVLKELAQPSEISEINYLYDPAFFLKKLFKLLLTLKPSQIIDQAFKKDIEKLLDVTDEIDLEKNPRKLISILKVIQHPLGEFANLYLYQAYITILQNEKDTQDKNEVLNAISVLHETFLSSIKNFSILEKQFLLKQILNLIIYKKNETQHENVLKLLQQVLLASDVDENIIYQMQTALVALPNDSESAIHIRNILIEKFKQEGDISALQKIIQHETRAVKLLECKEVYRCLADKFAQANTPADKVKAKTCYELAISLGDISAIFPLTKMTNNVDVLLDLYHKGVTHYVREGNKDHLKKIIILLKTLREKTLLGLKQHNKLAQIIETIPEYSELAEEAVFELKMTETIATLEKIYQQGHDQELQLDALKQSEISAVAQAALKLETYLTQKITLANAQQLRSKDQQAQQANASEYFTGMSRRKLNQLFIQNYFPAVAQTMYLFLNRASILKGSRRRKLYLCTKVLLLATHYEKAKIRFHLGDVYLQKCLQDAKNYLTKKSEDKDYEYKDFAQACLKAWKAQVAQEKLLLNPDVFILQDATLKPFHADVKHALEEVFKDHSDIDVSQFISKNNYHESIQYDCDDQPLAEFAPILAALKLNPAPKKKIITEEKSTPLAVPAPAVVSTTPELVYPVLSACTASNNIVVRVAHESKDLLLDESQSKTVPVTTGLNQSDASAKDLLDFTNISQTEMDKLLKPQVEIVEPTPAVKPTTSSPKPIKIEAVINAYSHIKLPQVNGVFVGQVTFGEALPYQTVTSHSVFTQPSVAKEKVKSRKPQSNKVVLNV